MFQIKVTNFQSIKEIELQVQGLTVVTAPSDSGKTAIVRAIDTLLTADWYQEAYQRWGTNLTTVSLKTPTDYLEFIRKGSSTTYTVQGDSYGKLGRKVPPELNKLGYGEVQIAESAAEVTTLFPQLQNQFEGPYQDTIKPSALTQLLGSFSNLAIYQMGLDRAKKQQGDIRRDLERLAKERNKLSAISETLEAFNPGNQQKQLDRLRASLDHADTVHGVLLDLHQKALQRVALQAIKQHPLPFGTGHKAYSPAKSLVVTARNSAIKIAAIVYYLNRSNGLASQKSVLKSKQPVVKPTAQILGRLVSLSRAVQLSTNTSQIQCVLHKTRGSLKAPFKQSMVKLLQINQTLVEGLFKLSSFTNMTSRIQTYKEELRLESLRSKKLSVFSVKKSFSGFLTASYTLSYSQKTLQALAQDIQTHKQTIQDIQGRRAALEKATQEGRCPLCFSDLSGHECVESKTKPRKKKTLTE